MRVDQLLRTEVQIELQDSTLYINNKTTRFHTCVANQDSVIRDLSRGEQWRYINRKQNPADDTSRGLDIETFLTSRWLAGPEFWETRNTMAKESTAGLYPSGRPRGKEGSHDKECERDRGESN